MPRSKDLKRVIRARMKKTGEAYTSARAHIIRKKPTPLPPRTRPADYAALAGMRDEAIAAKTGRTWREWVAALDREGAAGLPHRDIALLVSRKYGVGSWWTQTVTVGYERIKGLRERGQRRSGHYEVSRSRTFSVPVTVLFEAWAADAARRTWLGDVGATVRTATAPKSIRLRWPDGTIVIAGFTAKGEAKSTVAVAHTKLPDRAALDRAKQAWTDRLDALASMLASVEV